MRRSKHFDAKTRRLIAVASGHDERTVENVLDGRGRQMVAKEIFATIEKLGLKLPAEASK